MTAKDSRRPGGGNHRGTRDHARTSSEQAPQANKHYTRPCDVYQIHPTTMMRMPVGIGESGQKVIDHAVALARLVDMSTIPTPWRIEFQTGEEPQIQCGPRFEKSKPIGIVKPAAETQSVLDALGVSNMTILRNGWDNNIYVDYGRCGRIEFMANVYLGGGHHVA